MITEEQKKIAQEIKVLAAEMDVKLKETVSLGLTVSCYSPLLSNSIKVTISHRIEL